MVDSNMYSEVHRITDPDGLVCIITQRNSNGGPPMHTFAFVKEYSKNGQIGKSHWFMRRHTAAVRRLLSQAEEWLDREQERIFVAARRGERHA